MHSRESYLNELMLHARQFAEARDVYNAAKLLRRIARLAPEWWEPHAELAELYKRQGEWKAMMHFAKRAVALQAANPDAWRNLAIAATALKKNRIVKTVWKKFGILTPNPDRHSIVALRAPSGQQFEILWAHPLDPARAALTSIPYPSSGLHYHDIVLYDFHICGHTMAERRRYPVYDHLRILRHSLFKTFSCTVHTADKKPLRVLERLCRQAGLGFENWTSTTRAMPFHTEKALPEFYHTTALRPYAPGESLIAIAAHRLAEAETILRNWQLITLHDYESLAEL